MLGNRRMEIEGLGTLVLHFFVDDYEMRAFAMSSLKLRVLLH